MSYKQLTEDILRILANPETPAELYNPLTESILGLIDHHDANVFHPDVLRVALPIACEREADAASATADAAPAPFQRCAEIIADLLESDATPEVLRSTLVCFCEDLSNQMSEGYECVCSPETTRKHLPSILARAEARGIRCVRGGIMFDKGGESE